MLNERNPDVKPDWRYVKIDETKYWGDNSPAKLLGKKLVATYAYNKNSVTYCCSLTPSYWMLYLGTEAQYDEELTEEQRELIDDNIREAESEDQCNYYDCSCVDKMESKPLPYNIDVDRTDFSDDEAGENEYNNKVEDCIRESFAANPC
jgi:hypothetical protein